ncbi:hypothetical protein Q0Z83_097900 [Actinoplanes sichuanensis]|nr:hypothetical protein Q0Z83_097900 [Actinoplanes sichuanensis]
MLDPPGRIRRWGRTFLGRHLTHHNPQKRRPAARHAITAPGSPRESIHRRLRLVKAAFPEIPPEINLRPIQRTNAESTGDSVSSG